MPSKLVRRYRRKKHKRNPEGGGGGSSSGPPAIGELVEFIGPGFAAFAAARLGTRVAAVEIAKRKPSWGKHAGAAAAISAFLAAWLLAHKWKWLSRYHTPVVVGAGIAALQSIIQLYIPRLGWMVADASTELAAQDAIASAALPATGAGGQQLPAGMTPVDDDPNSFVYNDAYDPGRMDHQQQAADQHAEHAAVDNLDDLDVQGVGGGMFG